MPSKKKNKRNQVKHPALDKTYNLKTRTDLYENDYINGYHDEETGETIRALTDKEKDFLNKFNEEFINASFKSDKKRIHKVKKAEHPKNVNLKKLNKIILDYIREINNSVNGSDITNTSKSNLRRIISKFRNEIKKKIKQEMKFIKDFYKKDVEDRNNQRNRCILTKAKAQGKSISMDELPEHYSIDFDVEDSLIEQLDFKKLKSAENDAD